MPKSEDFLLHEFSNNHVAILQKNAEQFAKIESSKTRIQQEELKKRQEAEADAEAELEKLLKQGVDKRTKVYKDAAQRAQNEHRMVLAAKKELEDAKLNITKQATIAAETYEANSYKRMTASQRREYNKKVAEDLEVFLDSLQNKYDLEEAHLKKLKELRDTSSGEERERYEREIVDQQKKLDDLSNQQSKAAVKAGIAKRESNRYSKLELFGSKEARAAQRDQALKNAQERVDRASTNSAIAKSNVHDIEASISEKDKSAFEKIKKLQSEIRKAEQKGDKKKLASLKGEMDLATKGYQDRIKYAEALAEEDAANHELELAQREEQKAALKKALDPRELGMAALSKAADNISGHLNDMYGAQGRMEGRLQGSGLDWNKSVLGVTWNVGMSGLVSQKGVVAKMVELVDSGVAYNLDMRAFLAETSENIASTFDAANGTLLRLIRLQQADTTAARLGMEASLTKLFNEYFKDTSYLTDSGPADSVASAILDASATMDKNAALAFEFNVQKWLGSLYSLGMSAEAVQMIAEGINYLGTGNVSALNGNTAMQTLFAMSASRAGGKSYADMLTTGITSEDTNKLLRAMVGYLAEIADSQNNYVTASAYAELFGMSLTDLRTFSSLKDSEITNIFNQSTDYDKLTKETQSQLSSIITRVSMSQMIDTVIENAEVGAASLIGSNAFTYGMWKALSVLKDYVGEIKIPGITAMGTGIASGLDLLNLAQTAMAGLGLVGSLVAGIGSMAQGGATNLSNWSFEEYTSRGGTLSLLDTGSLNTTSYSASLGAGSASSEDMSDVSLESGKEKALESEEITSEEFEEQKEIPQKIFDALAGESTPTVLSLLQEIDGKLATDRVFYTSIVGQGSGGATLASQISTLSAEVNSPTNSTGEIVSTASTTSTASSGTGSNALGGTGTSESESLDMQSIITAAVEEAIRNIAGYTGSGSGLPVYVTNNSGGML